MKYSTVLIFGFPSYHVGQLVGLCDAVNRPCSQPTNFMYSTIYPTGWPDNLLTINWSDRTASSLDSQLYSVVMSHPSWTSVIYYKLAIQPGDSVLVYSVKSDSNMFWQKQKLCYRLNLPAHRLGSGIWSGSDPIIQSADPDPIRYCRIGSWAGWSGDPVGALVSSVRSLHQLFLLFPVHVH